MIKQIVNSEEELRKLIEDAVNSDDSNNQHGDNSDEEIDEIIEDFLEENNNIHYPCFMFVDFTFHYNGFDVDLTISSLVLTKNEMLEILAGF